MSGLEIAGVLLGTFPLIISGLEHWRDVAKVGGFFWRVRKEYGACRREVQFYEILYKRNLKELLQPIVADADDITRLISDPGSKDWSREDLQGRLETRLQESYELYMSIVGDMNEAADELRKELALDKATVQSKLRPPEHQQQKRSSSPVNPSKLSSMRTKWDYETFRVKFSFNEPVRNEIFERLRKSNERLEKLLSTSDKIAALESVAVAPSTTKQTSSQEVAFKTAWRKAELLYKALQASWRCSCQQHHLANLRLSHCNTFQKCFDVILMFDAPGLQANNPWWCKSLQCGQISDCACTPVAASILPQQCQSVKMVVPQAGRQKKVMFNTPQSTIPRIEILSSTLPRLALCQLLSDGQHQECIGVIHHDDESYHLQPTTKWVPNGIARPLTLDYILSKDFGGQLTRRQRYSIALLLVSSVAQLQFTPWLNSGLSKEEVLFFPNSDDDDEIIPYQEPFIRQGFEPQHLKSPDAVAQEWNYASLGILLLELCFGRRLEDHPLRTKFPSSEGQAKQAFDLMAALKWSQSVNDEGGEDYAAAVKWCFLTETKNANRSWRSDIIKNVINPLEKCQECFKTIDVL